MKTFLWLQTFYLSIGIGFAKMFGGWNGTLTTLFTMMCLDVLTGIIVALFFKNSTKTKSGKLSSRACVKGISRKVVMFFLVCGSYRIQLMLGVDYLRDGVAMGFIITETISLLENAYLMGIKTELLEKAIDTLKGGNTNGGK